MPRTIRLATIAALVGAAWLAPATAQKLVPGLWENTSTMKIQGADGLSIDPMAELQQQMASMPAEQRKMMEGMLAKQGIGAGAKPNTMRVCISPEQAARNDMPFDDRGCKRDLLERKGNTLRLRFSCQGPPASTGEGTYTFVSDKAFTSTMSITSKEKEGTDTMQITGSGRWVAADCGTLKPRP